MENKNLPTVIAKEELIEQNKSLVKEVQKLKEHIAEHIDDGNYDKIFNWKTWVSMIRKMYAPQASSYEFGIFLNTARKHNLSIENNEIYCIKFKDRFVIMFSYTGKTQLAMRNDNAYLRHRCILVREKDDFEYNPVTSKLEDVKHIIKNGDRGEIVGGYIIIEFSDNRGVYFEYFDKKDINIKDAESYTSKKVYSTTYLVKLFENENVVPTDLAFVLDEEKVQDRFMASNVEILTSLPESTTISSQKIKDLDALVSGNDRIILLKVIGEKGYNELPQILNTDYEWIYTETSSRVQRTPEKIENTKKLEKELFGE